MGLPAPARTLLLLVCLSAVLHGSSPKEDCTGKGILRSFRLVTNCTFTTLKGRQKEEIKAPSIVLYVPILYLLAFLIGLPANLLALWVLLFHTKKLPSTTLLINLTVSDLMLLTVLPFRVVYHFRGNDWPFGEPFCRAVTAVFYGNMYCSVMCLALVALDRYVALVHPFGAKTFRSRRTSLYMSLGVWVMALAAMLPLLISRQSYRLDDPAITTCHDALPEEELETYFLPYFSTLFALCFLLPLSVVVFCYAAVLHTLLAAGGRRYGHAVRVTVLVLVVFLVCLLPSNILLLVHYSETYMEYDGEDDLYLPYVVSLAVSTFNSCVDPFIFYYVSDDFRDKARRVLCRRGGDGDPSSSSSGNKVTYSSSSSSGATRSKVTLLSRSSQQQESFEGQAA